MTTERLTELYDHRFSAKERERKEEIWEVLCTNYFQQFVKPTDTVLDLACGQGEFIRNIRCAKKIAVDLNQQVMSILPPEIRFINARADQLAGVDTESV